MINTSFLSSPIFPGQFMRAFIVLALLYSWEEDNPKCEMCGPRSEWVAMLERVKIYLFIIFWYFFYKWSSVVDDFVSNHLSAADDHLYYWGSFVLFLLKVFVFWKYEQMGEVCITTSLHK